MNKETTSISIQYVIILGAVICFLFITETLGPQLWHIPFVKTGQNLLFVVYFIYTYNYRYKLFTHNKVETLLLITCFASIFVKFANGSTSIISDSLMRYIIPIMMLLSLKYLPLDIKRKVRTIIYIFYIIECTFAIYERIIEFSFFPFSIGGIDDFAEYQQQFQTGSGFRSCSLLGNPLTNAVIVMTLYPFLLFDLKKKYHVILLTILTLLGLSSFNARGATIIFFLVFTIYYFNTWFHKEKRKTFYFFIYILICLTILLGFSQTEMAGRLFNEDKLLDESANTRLNVFSQLSNLSFIDYFFGTPLKTQLISENGVVNFVILYGAPFLIFYLYTHIKVIQFYTYSYTKIEKMVIFLCSFGVAALNPSFVNVNYPIFLFLCLTIFPNLRYINNAKRINNNSIIQ